ncbi:MAG: hypothetical protein WCS94_14360 [Verrucomicrobiota bacterium]
MFTVRNATLVAIMQLGVIVAGVLASGLWHKVAASTGLAVPNPVGFLYSYGIGGFFIPLGWIAFALWIRSRPEVADEIKTLSFWLGVFVLIVLLIFVIYANVSPFFRIMWCMGEGDAA